MIWYEHLAWCCSLIDERFFSAGAGAPEIGIPNKQSVTTGQSGGELIGVYGAKLHARERATTEALKQKADPFFCILRPISGVEIWTQNWVPQVAQQLKLCRKLDPVFGPPRLAWFVPGASLLQPFFPHVG